MARSALCGMMLLSTLGAGCQEEQAFTLKALFGLGSDEAAAREALRDPCTTAQNNDELVKEMLAAVNTIRRQADLRPLRASDTLDQIADFYACRLIDGGFFDHQDPFDGSTIKTRAANFGYAFAKIGETLAAGQLSVDEVMKGWMDSTPHKAVILDRAYVEIGVSVRIGGEYGTYWVLEFGRPIEADFTRIDETDGEKVEGVKTISSQPASDEPSSQPSHD